MPALFCTFLLTNQRSSDFLCDNHPLKWYSAEKRLLLLCPAGYCYFFFFRERADKKKKKFRLKTFWSFRRSMDKKMWLERHNEMFSNCLKRTLIGIALAGEEWTRDLTITSAPLISSGPLCLQENASAWTATWGTRSTSTSAFAASGAQTRGECWQPHSSKVWLNRGERQRLENHFQ